MRDPRPIHTVKLATSAQCACQHTLRFHPEGKACQVCILHGLICQAFRLMNRKMRRTAKHRKELK